MSKSPSKRVSNVSLPNENNPKKPLLKMDFSQLEVVIQDLYNQNNLLSERIEQMEITLNKDEVLSNMQHQLDLATESNHKIVVSMGNVQSKIIELEKEFLR